MKRITCMIFLLCTVFVLSAQESAKTLVVDLKVSIRRNAPFTL